MESQALFAKALEVWLEMRKEINYAKEESENPIENEIRRKDSIHEKFEGKQLYEAFELKFQEKFPGYLFGIIKILIKTKNYFFNYLEAKLLIIFIDGE